MKRRGFLGALVSAPVVAKVAPEVVAEVPKKAVAAYVPPTTSLFPRSAFSAVVYVEPMYLACSGCRGTPDMQHAPTCHTWKMESR
jgi:hypothetical protein